MVNRSSILPTEKVNFFPYSEDLAYLRAKYGSGAPSPQRMGYGPAMREIIHAAVKRLRERERQRLDTAITLVGDPHQTYQPIEEPEDAIDPAE